MHHFSKDNFTQWERFYRANLLNSISGYKPTHLVATLHADGTPNLSLFHNVVHLGADPALIGMVSRPRAASPHTIANIESHKQWTMNAVTGAFLEKAHQCSAKYGATVSEFEAAALTPEYKDGWPVPVVQESPVQYALELVEIVPITHNQTYFVIGSITHIWIAPDLIQPDGFVTLHKASVVCSAGMDAYYTAQPIARMAYAKPDMPPARLTDN